MKILIPIILSFFISFFAHAQSATILSITPPANGTYSIGSHLNFTVNYSVPVIVGGTPSLAMNIGGNLRHASYVSGSGSSSLLFRYLIVSGYGSTTGVGIASPIALNGGSIRDLSSANASLIYKNIFYSGVLVNAPAPSILSIDLPATIPALYLAGDTIDFKVNFSEPMIANKNTSRLKLSVGGTFQAATLLSGSGTSTFIYRYLIGIDHFDSDGIEMISPLEPNTSTILNINGMALVRTFTPPSLLLMKIDGRVPTVLSNTKPADGLYTAGNTFEFSLLYNRTVNVTGNPRVAFNVGYPPLEVAQYADFLGGSGTNQLTFRYTVTPTDEDSDGVFFNQFLNMDQGSIVDDVGNLATFKFWGMKLTNAGYSSVVLDGSPVPTITSVVAPVNGKYETGQALDFFVNFSRSVVVSMVPRIAVTVGTSVVYANYVSGGGTSTLLFRYTVNSGDADADGISVASPVELNSGAIQSLNLSNNANLNFSVLNTTGVLVDGLDPIITSVTPPNDGAYAAGENLNFTLNYSGPVSITGAPKLNLTVGSTNVSATYVSGSGTSNLTFRYTVTASDSDTDGITLTSPVDISSGAVLDSLGYVAQTTFTSPNLTNVRVDTLAPTIAAVSGPAPGTYSLGAALSFTVNFNEAVSVTGLPRIALQIGTNTRYATYISGSGSTNLNFSYTVIPGDIDSDGIVVSSPLLLNGGTIQDASGNLLSSLGFTPPDTSGVLTYAYSGIVGFIPAPNGTYNLGQTLPFKFTYSETVTVTGTPRLKLTVGAQTLYANYASGSNSKVLTFNYTVGASESDLDGIDIVSPLELNGGSITGVSGSALSFTPGVTNILIDGLSTAGPLISPPAIGTYGISQTLDFIAQYVDPVNVTGTPLIQLSVGGVSKSASYVSGSGTTNLRFQYTVLAGDLDSIGIDTVGPAILLNGGTIKNFFGTSVSATFAAANYPGLKVDGVAPVITAVSAPANGNYGNGQALNFGLQFSESITVSGSPRVALVVGSTTRYATYLSGSGTSNLIFRYVVSAGDIDNDGISSASIVDLNAGSLKDAASNNLSPLTFTAPNLALVRVNALTNITSVTPPVNGTYTTGNTLNFQLQYSSIVTVSGVPSLSLTVGATPVSATYISGSGSSTLVFRYVVQSGHSDTDGIDLASPVALNSGTILDSLGNVAQLSFISPNLTSVRIDALAPTITAVSGPAPGTYSLGAALGFIVNFNEVVSVSGSPRIALQIGTTTRYATYISGSGSAALNFSYTVIPGDIDSDGIVVSSPLQLNGGSIQDALGNSATSLPFTPPDTSGVLTYAYSGIVRFTPAPNATYTLNQTLPFKFTYSETVTVTGTPRLKLTVGSQTLYADYASGSNSKVLTFNYTVGASESDGDGIDITSPLELNGGAITGVSGSALSFTPGVTNILIDGLSTAGPLIGPPADGTYGIGQNIEFVAQYVDPVNVTGTPVLQLMVGSVTKSANYLSGSGTTVLRFRYTVQNNDLDQDGINTVGPAILLNGGTIKNFFGSAASPAFAADNYLGIKVDGVAPMISTVTAPANGNYGQGQNIDLTLRFTKIINVTGTPRIPLTVGSVTRYADYQSGSGTTDLVFRYVVLAGDMDNDGLSSSGAIDLNSGSLLDGALNGVTPLTFTEPNLSQVKVNSLTTISSVTPPANGTYYTGNTLSFQVLYSRPVVVTGSPSLSLTVGASVYPATYVSGSGSSTLIFSYVVQTGHSDTDGISVSSLVSPNGGSIVDGLGNSASNSLTPPNTSGVIVSGIGTILLSITPPADGTYVTGAQLNFTMNYSSTTLVTGSPRLQLTVGTTTVFANYVSGSGTNAHLFRYTVLAGQNDSDGITSVGPALDLNAGTIKDAQGTAATITFTGTTYANKKVDTLSPTVTLMTVSANKTYAAGELINFTASYSEIVTVTGTPRLTLTVGTTTSYATYLSGSGTTSLVFQYVVTPNLLDTNGITALNSIDLNAGFIKDLSLNSQTNLTFTLPVLTGVLVDSMSPTISSLSTPPTQIYSTGAAVNVTAVFSEAVAVTGSPSLTLNVGGTLKAATYVSGSGTSSLLFRYNVALGDNDADGVERISPLILNAGTVKDLQGNSAALTFANLIYTGVKIDTTAPTLVSVTYPADATYRNAGLRPTISFTVNYNEAVTVVGIPRIHFQLGSALRYATYASGSGTGSLVFSYAVAATDFDLNGIDILNAYTIDLNAGSIRDSISFNAPLTFGSAPTNGVRVANSVMSSWYDISDSSSLVFTGFNVTTINDKIGSYALTRAGTGAVYSATNFNGGTNAFVTCSSASPFDGVAANTPVAMVAVYRAPSSVTNQFLFYSSSTVRPMVQFSSTASGGTVSFGVTGRKYSAGVWSAAAATATNVWASGQVAARGFAWSSSQRRVNSLCQMDGQLAEAFFFSTQPTTAQMTELQSYISARYGLTFP